MNTNNPNLNTQIRASLNWRHYSKEHCPGTSACGLKVTHYSNILKKHINKCMFFLSPSCLYWSILISAVQQLKIGIISDCNELIKLISFQTNLKIAEKSPHLELHFFGRSKDLIWQVKRHLHHTTGIGHCNLQIIRKSKEKTDHFKVIDYCFGPLTTHARSLLQKQKHMSQRFQNMPGNIFFTIL